MIIKIAENIKSLRKGKGMTQEQLAETLNVTVGAVSKWESGATTPELGLITEMAEFFETSVDYLLGYELKSGNMERIAKRIKDLMVAKDYQEAVQEAEKALQKFSNSFTVVYNSASMYAMKGLEMKNEADLHRALDLYNRSCELLAFNTDPTVGDITIQNQIARIYLMLDDREKALERWKKNNFDSINSHSIGYTLSFLEHKPEEALKYLSDALWVFFGNFLSILHGYENAYFELGKTKEALSIIDWGSNIYEGLKIPGKVSYLEKGQVYILVSTAITAYQFGHKDIAADYLRRAKQHALIFDTKPTYSMNNVKYFHSTKITTAYDNFGRNALDGIAVIIKGGVKDSDELLKFWEQINEE